MQWCLKPEAWPMIWLKDMHWHPRTRCGTSLLTYEATTTHSLYMHWDHKCRQQAPDTTFRTKHSSAFFWLPSSFRMPHQHQHNMPATTHVLLPNSAHERCMSETSANYQSCAKASRSYENPGTSQHNPVRNMKLGHAKTYDEQLLRSRKEIA